MLRASLRRLIRRGDAEVAAAPWCLPSVYAACVQEFPGVVYDIGTGTYSAVARANKHNTVIAFAPGDAPVLDAFDEQRHPGRSTVIRIAVDGREDVVLRGATRILKTHRPLVFCDVTGETDAGAIERIRRQIRYFDIRLHDGAVQVGNDVDFDAAGPHHLLVPNEKLDRVLELVKRHAIDVQWPVNQ